MESSLLVHFQPVSASSSRSCQAAVLICECLSTVSQPLVVGVVAPAVVLICECLSTVSQPLVVGVVAPAVVLIC